MTALEGRRVGGYKIIERIGKGGMAWVYRATHKSFGEVAFKILPPYATVETEDRQRFLREARTIKLLDDIAHPSIVKLYEAGSVPSPFSKEDDLLFIAMELLPGGTLHQRIQDGTLVQRFLLPMMIDLGEALGMAHAKGIIHRDIKPANILFRHNHIPVLCDFGIARLGDATALTATGMGIGTIDYMAPEQLDARAAPASPATDVYALALMLYEALAGANPFRAAGSDLRVVMTQIVHTTPRSIAIHVPTLSPAVAALIDRSLSKNPDDRPHNGHAFAEALRAAGVMARGSTSSGSIPVLTPDTSVASTPTPTPPPSRSTYIAAPKGSSSAAALAPLPTQASKGTPPVTTPGMRTRRTRLPLVLGAALLSIVLLGGAWALVRPDPAERVGTTPPTITPLPEGTILTVPGSASSTLPAVRATSTRVPTPVPTETPTPVPTETPAPKATPRPVQPTARPQPTATRRPAPATARPAQPTNPPPAQPQPAPTNTPVPPPAQPQPQPEAPTTPPQVPTEAPATNPDPGNPSNPRPTNTPRPNNPPPATNTPRPEPATNTPQPVPATNTPVPATNTPAPATNTPTLQPTVVVPTPVCDVRTNPGCVP